MSAPAAFLAPATARAEAPGEAEVFTVRGVPVDVTATTASEARRLALAAGQTEALRRMLERVTRRVDYGALPRVDAESAANFVQGFEVTNEKTSSVRYLAELSVRFKPSEIRRLLRESGVPFAVSASPSLLVLPVLRTPDGLVLWDASNRWRTAWTLLPVRRGLVPMIVPFGDLEDISGIDATQAMLGDPDALAAIADRYGAGGTLIALATLSLREDGLYVLDVAASQPADAAAAPLLLSFTVASADEVDAVLNLAATETAAGIEEAWINSHLMRFDNLQRMTLAVPVSGVEHWATFERKLTSAAGIARVELRVLRRDSAEVMIEYFGSEQQLAAALGKQGLDLETPLPSLSVPTGNGAVGQRGVEDSSRLRVLRSRGT